MRDNDKPAFVKLVTLTLKLYDKTIDAEVMSLWWQTLCKHDLEVIRQSLSIHMEFNQYAPKPAHITAIINKPKPDGRPSFDEAWAMIPRDELGSCVMTNEMAEAFGICKGLLDSGDAIAARMTFKAAYERIVEENRSAGIKPRWFPSLGHDKLGREQVIIEAVRLGRLGAEHAKQFIQAPEVLALEDKTDISPEKAKANIAKIKMLLNGGFAKQEKAA